MLVAIVVAFLTCNTLAFVVNIMEKLELHTFYVLLVSLKLLIRAVPLAYRFLGVTCWSCAMLASISAFTACSPISTEVSPLSPNNYVQVDHSVLMCHYTHFCCRFGKADNNFHSINLSSF